MIRGAKFWNDRQRAYYSQSNNPLEQILRKLEVKDWLESCAPTYILNCIAALGYDVEIKCPGVYRPQPEEVLMGFFHDSRNYQRFREIRHDINPNTFMGNRVPQFHPFAAAQVFKANARYVENHEFEFVCGYFESGHSIGFLLKQPSHYIAGVAYDDDTDEIIYNDSRPERFPDGNGFNRRMSRNEFRINVEPFVIIYTGGGL